MNSHMIEFETCSPSFIPMNFNPTKAMNFLRNTDLSITEIALEIGFNNNYLSRQFRKTTGMSPRTYRQTQN